MHSFTFIKKDYYVYRKKIIGIHFLNNQEKFYVRVPIHYIFNLFLKKFPRGNPPGFLNSSWISSRICSMGRKRLVVPFNSLDFGALSNSLVGITKSWLAQTRVGWCYTVLLFSLLG